jgi:NAD(P)H dehydrogenase (quinone)
MILLTGAAGKTGQAVLASLLKRDVNVRVLVRNEEQNARLKHNGEFTSIIGDLRDKSAIQNAVRGCDSIYYICPNVSPDEVNIGEDLIAAAQEFKTQRFVYHSVLHPQIELMPHHWQKSRMEEIIFRSGIDFTILQPCAYMQNILSNLKSIMEQGLYQVPYSTYSRISIVDLDDIAEAAATVLTQEGHSNAIYELAGPQPLSQEEVASIIGTVLGKKVIAKSLSRNIWTVNARKNGLEEYQISILLKMFEYYDLYGLVGNSFVLSKILGRSPTTFEQVIGRQSTIKEKLSPGGN